MYNLGYDPNTLNILYEMNEETDIIIRTPVGNTDNIILSQRSGKTRHNIWIHHVLCRNIHSKQQWRRSKI